MVVGLALSVLLAWLVLRRVDPEGLVAGLRRARLGILLLSVVTRTLGLVCMGWRVQVLLEPVGRIPLELGFRAQLLGFAANNVLPLRIGEVAKADYLARHASFSRASTLATTVTERVLDAVCLLALLCLVAPIAVPYFEHLWAVALSAAGVIAAGLACWWLARHPTFLGRGLDRIARLFGHPPGGGAARVGDAFSGGLAGLASSRVALLALLASLLYWLSSLIGIRLWLEAFALSLPWYAPVVLLVFLAFGTALPAAPGFIGTWDYFFILGLGVFAVDTDTATIVALAGHAVAIVPLTVAAGALLPGELRRLLSATGRRDRKERTGP